mgnify:CR=1 FL=1
MKKILFILCSMVLLLEAANPIAVFKTTKGEFEVELRPDIAPKAVENFTTHAKNGYYNGLIFHRVIKNFMIQGGDPLEQVEVESQFGVNHLKMSSHQMRYLTKQVF